MQSTLAKLSVCRTEALGGRWYRCPSCQGLSRMYNSCGDRHCPSCSGSKRTQWVERTEQLLLDGIDYYQVVFTLPKKLSRLTLGNRRKLYSLLFQSSWQAIEKSVQEEQGYKAAAALMLHTWNQRLEAHTHVHALIPGGGPSLTKPNTWKATHRHGRPTSKYLVDESQLRRSYRDFFIAGLEQLYRRGELKLRGEFSSPAKQDHWDALISRLESTKWVVYIEPPPHEGCRPQHVVRYLGRYLTGGPISDRRLISADDKEVVFWAREGTQAGGTSQRVEVELTPVEFVRRWCLHILPKGFVKTRRYGGWSNKHRAKYLARCAQLLLQHTADTGSKSIQPTDESSLQTDELSIETMIGATEGSCPRCPQCDRAMRLLEGSVFQPSWAEMKSLGRWPVWYQPSPAYADTS